MIIESMTKQNYGRSQIGKSAKMIIPQHKGIFIAILGAICERGIID